MSFWASTCADDCNVPKDYQTLAAGLESLLREALGNASPTRCENESFRLNFRVADHLLRTTPVPANIIKGARTANRIEAFERGHNLSGRLCDLPNFYGARRLLLYQPGVDHRVSVEKGCTPGD